MKTARIVSAIAAAFSCLALSAPSYAAIDGYFDCVTVSSTDFAKGWVCESTDPANTPSYGTLAVFVNGNHYADFGLGGGTWSQYYPGVNGAGYCGSHAYVGFVLPGWFYIPSSSTISVYFRDNGGTLIPLIGGSPKTMTGSGTFGTCGF